MKIYIEKGRMLDAPSEWVFFILTNTDIMVRINNSPLVLSKSKDRNYYGHIWGVRVNIEMLGDQQPLSMGEINIVADIRMPFRLGRTHTVVYYRYRSIDKVMTMVDLRFTLETSGAIMGLYGSLRRGQINAYIEKVLGDNERAAILIAKNDNSLCELLTEEQQSRINNFRSSNDESTTIHSEQVISQHISDVPGKDRRTWDAELRELTTMYEGFQGKVNTLTEELKGIRDARDAIATLVYARRMLEVFVTKLCETVLNRPRGTEPLSGLIDKLGHTDYVPDYICTSMKNLNSLSTYGAHPKAFSPRQVREALIALCSIMEWHISTEKQVYGDNKNATKSSSKNQLSEAEQEYKHLCRGAWLDGTLSEKEKEMLEIKRIELNISPEDARKIESEINLERPLK